MSKNKLLIKAIFIRIYQSCKILCKQLINYILLPFILLIIYILLGKANNSYVFNVIYGLLVAILVDKINDIYLNKDIPKFFHYFWLSILTLTSIILWISIPDSMGAYKEWWWLINDLYMVTTTILLFFTGFLMVIINYFSPDIISNFRRLTTEENIYKENIKSKTLIEEINKITEWVEKSEND